MHFTVVYLESLFFFFKYAWGCFCFRFCCSLCLGYIRSKLVSSRCDKLYRLLRRGKKTKKKTKNISSALFECHCNCSIRKPIWEEKKEKQKRYNNWNMFEIQNAYTTSYSKFVNFFYFFCFFFFFFLYEFNNRQMDRWMGGSMAGWLVASLDMLMMIHCRYALVWPETNQWIIRYLVGWLVSRAFFFLSKGFLYFKTMLFLLLFLYLVIRKP